MTKMNIKTGDTVKVITGKDKGAQGEVLFAYPEKGRVTVQGVNLVHKALRPTQANPNGGIDTREAATYYLVRFAPRLAPISRTALAANCLSG